MVEPARPAPRDLRIDGQCADPAGLVGVADGQGTGGGPVDHQQFLPPGQIGVGQLDPEPVRPPIQFGPTPDRGQGAAKTERLPAPAVADQYDDLVGISDFIVNYWLFILIGMLIVVVVFQLFVNGKRGRLIWDKFKLGVPVFGSIMFGQSMQPLHILGAEAFGILSGVTAITLAAGRENTRSTGSSV